MREPVLIDYRHYDSVDSKDKSWLEAKRLGEASLHRLINEVGSNQGLDWWLSSVSSRNPFSSPLFSCLTILHHINLKCQDDWRDGQPRRLIVGSLALNSIILDLLKSNNISTISVSVIQDEKAFRRYISITRCCFGHLVRFITLKCIRGSNAPCMRIGSLIDFFVFKGWKSGDRYYTGLFDSLKSLEIFRIYIAPEFISSNPRELFLQIKMCKKEFGAVLIKETFLSYSDFFKAILHSSFGVKIPVDMSVNCCGMNIAPLIREEIRHKCGIDQTIRGWLNFYFFKRLRYQGFSIDNVIDWFENQSIDKGWNAGVKKYFPEARSIGYQAFPDLPGYFCAFPTAAEQEAGVLPRELAAIGLGYRDSRIRFCPELTFTVAPAFRFQHVWHPIAKPLNQRDVALVVLPIDRSFAKSLIAEALAIRDEFWADNGLKLIFRPHPSVHLNALGLSEAELSRIVLRMDRSSFPVSIESARLMIGVLSSTSLEAVARSVPVALKDLSFDNYDNFPPESPAELIANFGATQSLESAIESLLASTSNLSPEVFAKIENLKSLYFEKVDKNSIKKFLGLS